MKPSRWKVGAVLATGGVVLAVAAAPSVLASGAGQPAHHDRSSGHATAGAPRPASSPGDRISYHPAARSAAEQRRITDYWTPERMRDAVPVTELVGDPAPAKGANGAKGAKKANGDKGFGPAAVERGKPTTVGGTLPGNGDWSGHGDWDAIPQPGDPWSDGGEVARTAGRVFVRIGDGIGYCSANAVTSDNKSTVLTAGHCVHDAGRWAQDWVFVPGYRKGNAPYGEWTAAGLLAPQQWTSSGDSNYDVGAVVVNRLGGSSLTDVVGGQGLAFNGPYDQTMYAFGYPSVEPYKGQRLIYCSGATARDYSEATRDHAMLCDMTAGSSGGPWFREFDRATGIGLQSSVNSFKYGFLPDVMFGPYFGAAAQHLYNTAQAL